VLKAAGFDFSPIIPSLQLRAFPAHQFNLHPAPQSVRHANHFPQSSQTNPGKYRPGTSLTE
jgi:hypothetical protein